MSLEANLSKARLAIDFVHRKMSMGASTPLGDGAPGASGPHLVVSGGGAGTGPRADGIPRWLADAAARAGRLGCGTCREHAAIAFLYLHERHRLRPLDYVVRTRGDHAFVVIGRDADGRIDDPATWGRYAAVCDPWDSAAYAASELEGRIRGTARSFDGECLARVD